MERWHAPLDLRYTAAKARFVPLERPAVLRRAVRSPTSCRERRAQRPGCGCHAGGARSRTTGASSCATRPLDEVCLIQWQRCVESCATRARPAFRRRPGPPTCRTRTFVREPGGRACGTCWLSSATRAPFDTAAVGRCRPAASARAEPRLSRRQPTPARGARRVRPWRVWAMVQADGLYADARRALKRSFDLVVAVPRSCSLPRRSWPSAWLVGDRSTPARNGLFRQAAHWARRGEPFDGAEDPHHAGFGRHAR